MLHDPICVVGFFAVSQMTFDLTAISAILAVIGYSLNDTVIVFDRIRERARTSRKLAIAQVIDESINQTLSRTSMTKLVTLLVVVALLIFGGETLRGFSAALVIGIIAGTYSSIYISAALALDSGLARRRFAGAQGDQAGRNRRPAVGGIRMDLLADPQVWVSFLTLAVLEIVLGIDNIIFLSLLVDRCRLHGAAARAFSAWASRC